MGPPSRKQAEIVSDHSSELKLPDASFLLNLTAVPSNLLNSSDHSSRVAAGMAESVARKRELNGSAASVPRNKVPKGTLPHSKGVPDTVGGRSVPPQLAGSEFGFGWSKRFASYDTSLQVRSVLHRAAFRWWRYAIGHP
ncbi:hypothetical protein DH2020_029133 [Rehmannia glutinosa]|uniref:Uncharacterized protein n=1 Tax=Rehmannia glutinosa TaxID=99300 RepID=A0ABR0VQD4_REHGL